MSKIIALEIKNFRGIKNLSLDFNPNQNLVCFIGRGDTGKSSILSAISSVLSSNWNLSFYDTDFYNSDIHNPIEITATLIELPEKLLNDNKFGLYTRGFNTETKEIIDDFIENSEEHLLPCLTCKLSVDNSLEPEWVIVNNREQDEKPINSKDRSLFNCNIVSDYIDSHFSWNRGNPLYSLLQMLDTNSDSINENVIIQHLRTAKNAIDENEFDNLKEATTLIITQAAELGLNIGNTKTTLDSRELTIKDGRISLHENAVPFRLKGKGSKRLASIAIQSAIVHQGGIMLIDEIEQGLEPDRIKQTVRTLNENIDGQIFITTHSRDAITELGSQPLRLLIKNDFDNEIIDQPFDITNEELQKAVRACPEAFFAKKVIVCEGATEVGICRALDKWRVMNDKQQMSFANCVYIDGTGNTIIQRVEEINNAGLITSLLCDSDLPDINSKKKELRSVGIQVFDCENNCCLETQVFKDLSWTGILQLTEYAIMTHYVSEEAFIDSVKSKFSGDHFPENWRTSDSDVLRLAFADASVVKKNEWFKTIHHGEKLGNIIFEHIDDMGEKDHLRNTLIALSSWIDK